MKICRSVAELVRAQTHTEPWAFVPTMGNLHAGHLALVTEAQRRAPRVVVSIYVNPLQFSVGEDFERYPRTEAADVALLEARGVDVVFLPGDADVYPRGQERQTRVSVPALSEVLCGASRPGHFEGVTTVVCRLLHLVRPACAVFGKKDYQQWRLVSLMVEDLGMGVDVVGVETVRAEDGLALSSRNGFLTLEERARAPALYRGLAGLARREAKPRGWAVAEVQAEEELARAGLVPEYVRVRRQGDLGLPAPSDRALVVLAAARLGRTRLIDNLEFSLSV